jgi:hypothetical protein
MRTFHAQRAFGCIVIGLHGATEIGELAFAHVVAQHSITRVVRTLVKLIIGSDRPRSVFRSWSALPHTL